MGTKLTNSDSIDKILKEMSVLDKARLVNGGSPFHTEAIPEYGIPAIYMIDSCTGLNLMEYESELVYQEAEKEAETAGIPLDREKNGYMGGLLLSLGRLQKLKMEQAQNGTSGQKKELGCYPVGISLGATWNPQLVRMNGSAMAKEIGSKGIDMILGPNINIHRDPLCGRLSESYSEDPYLISILAPELIMGIQEEGILACAKHFAANNQEKNRMGIREHVPERALREIYLPGFQACANVGVASFMSAYNQLNGRPSAENEYLLTDILRDEWKYEGFVVSDWGAVRNMVSALNAGTDLTMPGPQGIRQIAEAVEHGNLSIKKLDQAVANILRAVIKSRAICGEYPEFDMTETIRVTEKTAEEATILLENDGTLPLPLDSHVAFYGKRSRDFIATPEGSGAVKTDLLTNPYECTVSLLGASHVTFRESGPETRYWIVTVGANGQEGADRLSLEIDADEKIEIEKAIAEASAAGGKVILLVNATGPVDLTLYSGRVSAVLCQFFAGMQSGKAVTDILFGIKNPSGHLPLTWPIKHSDCPAFGNYPGENNEVWYGEGIYVGYRWYDARGIRTMYPFGHGLSYTTFEISDLSFAPGMEADLEEAELTVSIRIKNTGKYAGAEVIQLYIQNPNSIMPRPIKELKGFQKVFLEAGEEKIAKIKLNKQSFAGYYLEYGQWITEPGEKNILIGTSAEDIRLSKTVTIRCKDPFGLSARTSIGVIAADKQAIKVINGILEDDICQLAHVAIQFAPDKSLTEIWNGTVVQEVLKEKGMNEQQRSGCWDRILEEFELINMGRSV